MAIQLQKGANISLSRQVPNLKHIVIGLGWDARTTVGTDFDLDASAFMLDNQEKSILDEYFIFYNNLKSPEGALEHLGDNLDGQGEGDDEMITVSLEEIPIIIQKVVFTVTIHDAEDRNQNFGMISNAFIRVTNQETDEEIMRYNLGEDFSIETAMIFGELYRYQGEWKFRAVGQGIIGGLAALVKNYAIDIKDREESTFVI
ncbi:MAG: TerD family protein [Thiomargarita sp.]|nr:TerD family protein [Thiomargarita sp.]